MTTKKIAKTGKTEKKRSNNTKMIVSFTITPELNKKIVAYSTENGCNKSAALSILINKGLQTEQAYKTMAELPSMLNTLKAFDKIPQK